MKRAVLLLIGVSSSAHADVPTLVGSGSTEPIGNGALTMTDQVWLHENNQPDLAKPIKVPESIEAYFNLASCQCSRPGASQISPWFQGQYALEIDAVPDVSNVHRPLEIWVGAQCNDTIMRTMFCHQVVSAGLPDIASIQIAHFARPQVPVYDLMTPVPGDGPCIPQVLSAAEWGIADSMGTGVLDFFISNTIATDSLPPPVPVSFTVEPAENAIQLHWKAPPGNVSDIAYYQALCADSQGRPVTANPPAPRYTTARQLCGADEVVPLFATSVSTGTPIGGADANTSSLPQGLADLDPAFLCADISNPTATSMRIEGLKNGEPYTVVLITVDLYSNAAGTFFTSPLTPAPVTTFWEDLHDRGSNVQGGFCLIAETYGDHHPLTEALRDFRDGTLARTGPGRWLADLYYRTLGRLGSLVHGHVFARALSAVLLIPFVAFALAWHAIGLPGLLLVLLIARALFRARRRLRISCRVACVGVGAALFFVPVRSHAQAAYWEDPLNGAPEVEQIVLPRVQWIVGASIGPYTPQIDEQFGKTPGPYAQMFGSSSSWVPMLDVEYVVWDGYGQLAVGGTVGYLGRKAHAWVDGSNPDDPNRPRSPGDTNSFHLIPLAAIATYRYTVLDEVYGVPIVPYARAGLAYYPWWSTGPSGDLATVDGSNDAVGASSGVLGAIGLALRLERLDPAGMFSAAESAVLHTGFYIEARAAKVNSFGLGNKLSVGDNTWLVGLDFEF